MNFNSNQKDISGQKFGKLQVLEKSGRNNSGTILYKCLCDCGNYTNTTRDHLVSGNTRSCGCLRRGAKKLDDKIYSHIGKKYNKLTIVSINGERNKYNSILAECICECGVEKKIKLTLVTTGNLKSCGCYRLEVVKSKIGPLHNNWNKDISQEERRDNRNYDARFKEWSKKVKIRDNFTCQKCLQQSRNLRSHHIDNWKQYPALRYELSNGVCLCETCHKKIHKDYGLMTTRYHWEQFTIKNND